MKFLSYKTGDSANNIFYQVPKELLLNPYYYKLKAESILLYAMLFDRLLVSLKNNWCDKGNNIYIHFIYK